MRLLNPADIQQRARKLWDSGQFLRAWLAGEAATPVVVPVRPPSGKVLSEGYAEVQRWLGELRAGSKAVTGRGYALQERPVEYRSLGSQKLPFQAIIETDADLLALAGKRQAFERFRRLAEQTRAALPPLESFLREKPLVALERAEDWDRLLAVCGFFRQHPRPMRYLRELDIPGVDTKFVEQHLGLLSELLTRVLPVEAVDAAVVGLAHHGFERRFGLSYDEPQVRFRLLDGAIAGFTDMQVTLSEFAAWSPTVETVFITENKINGLSFPAVPGALVIFGLGYGVRALATVPWLREKALWYWGDIDTHGFAMLSQLRGYFPHARSLLMDRQTLLAHQALWGREPAEKRHLGELPHLDEAERSLLAELREDRLGERVRLEQERIPFSALLAALT